MMRPGGEIAEASPDEDHSAMDDRARFFHDALDDWLADPGITVVCGRWTEGAISELLPAGRARLLPPRYDGRFAGIRELRLEQGPHHLHVDLGRVHALAYVVAPSVCLGFDPSLEIRLLTTDEAGAPTDRWMVSLMFSNPYRRDGTIDQAAAIRFFRAAREQRARHPGRVRVDVAPEVARSVHGAALLESIAAATAAPIEGLDWRGALAALGAQPPDAPHSTETSSQNDAAAPTRDDPVIVPLLREALALRDASLVIFRDRTLVEFKTERLGGLHRYVEHGHVSWQIGAFDDHHCHLALGDVNRVFFSAEPVPCQGNRLNYTAWFLVPGACGNPYRPDGYFSITLNAPYRAGQPRIDVIEPMLSLYRRHADAPWVDADARFLEVLADGPPSDRFA